MSTLTDIPPARTLEFARRIALKDPIEWCYVNPEGVYPRRTACPCQVSVRWCKSSDPAPVSRVRYVDLVAHRDGLRDVYFFAWCEGCYRAYWSYLSWNGNVLNPSQPGLRERIPTWGPGTDLEREKDVAVAELLRRVDGQIIGPPLSTRTQSAEAYEHSGIVGLYTPMSNVSRLLLSQPTEGGVPSPR